MDLCLLIAAQLMSEFGSRIYLVVALWILTDTGVPSTTTASFMVASQLPGFLIAPLAGTLIDRHPRVRPFLVLPLFTSALLVGISVLVTVATGFSLSILFVCAVGLAIASSFYVPAVTIAIPLLSGPHLERANSLRALTYRLAQLIGPACAGALLLLDERGGALAAIAAFFCLSGLLQLFVHATSRDGARRGSSKPTLPASYLWTEPACRRLLVAEALFGISISPMAIVIPSFAKIDLSGSAQLYSILLSMIGLGGLTTGGLTLLARRLRTSLVHIVASLGMASACTAVMAFWMSDLIAMTCCFLFGASTVGWTVFSRSYLQKLLPAEIMGRYFGVAHAIGALLTPVGSLVAGVILEVSAPHEVLFFVSAGMLLAALFCTQVKGRLLAPLDAQPAVGEDI